MSLQGSPNTSDITNLIASEYLDRAGTAAFLGLKNPRTLIRWARDGSGPAITRIGRKVLYRKSSLVEWLTRQEERPSSARGRRNCTKQK